MPADASDTSISMPLADGILSMQKIRTLIQCNDKTILRPSYLHNGISYTGKMASLYWIKVGGWSQYKDVVLLV